MKIVCDGERPGEWGRHPGVYNVRPSMLANAIWISQVMSGRELVGRRPSGTSSGATMWVSKPWVSSHLGRDSTRAVRPRVLQFSSATPDSRLQIVSASTEETGAAPPGTRTFALWRRDIACVSHQRHGDLCCMPHTPRRLMHGERRFGTPQGSVGLPDLACAVVVSDFPRTTSRRQRSDWRSPRCQGLPRARVSKGSLEPRNTGHLSVA